MLNGDETMVQIPGLLLVNLPLAVVKLYEEKRFWGLTFKSLSFFALSLVAGTILGLISALIVLPIRLPLLSDIAAPTAQGFDEGFLEIFPKNISELFLRSGDWPLPALVLALCIGLAMAHDPIAAKPFVNVLDSFSRILHTINVFITEIAGALLIPISARTLHLLADFSSCYPWPSFSSMERRIPCPCSIPVCPQPWPP